MKMSEEMAVRLHRMMWSDMQRELGDNPDPERRIHFKEDWIQKMFPGESVANFCWLCLYTTTTHSGNIVKCSCCPIKWPMGLCSTRTISYLTSPISEILALPARNPSLDSVEADSGYYKFREGLLEKYSGLPASAAIMDHVAKIQEKAVEEYFERKPGAKLATTDVDQAFKQYAKEQKAPIFRALAEESGLDPTATVKAHINAIYSKGFDDGKDEEFERIMDKIGEMLKK